MIPLAARVKDILIQPKVRVLLVEDDEDDYLITRDLLKEVRGAGCELDWIRTYGQALAVMKRNEHDVYLLDVRLEDQDGLTLLREALAEGCRGPIILLTGHADHEVDMEAMIAGAADFLIKGQLAAPLLERSIRYALERKRSEDHLRKSERRLQRQNRALVELASSKTLDSGDLPRALREITEATARTLEVTRVSVWLREPDCHDFRCADRFDLATLSHSGGEHLDIFEYPEYHKALEQERLIASEEVRKDPRTKQLYARGDDHSITSRLDATIRSSGKMAGVVSHERTGAPYRWAPEEQNFAGSIADLVSLTLEARERRRAEEAREQLIQQLQEALSNIKTLSGLIPICACCKKIRDDSGFWNQLEAYVQRYSEARFSHGICPECAAQFYQEFGKDQP